MILTSQNTLNAGISPDVGAPLSENRRLFFRRRFLFFKSTEKEPVKNFKKIGNWT